MYVMICSQKNASFIITQRSLQNIQKFLGFQLDERRGKGSQIDSGLDFAMISSRLIR